MLFIKASSVHLQQTYQKMIMTDENIDLELLSNYKLYKLRWLKGEKL